MKIIIIGASGRIGREALAQSLAHPRVTRVVAFVRRDLPARITAAAGERGHAEKLRCVRVADADFAAWPDPPGLLREHAADAVGVIW